ncbi:MAG: c-type cytochrome, partial [Planctomycetales bacterium]|nr:c-type cytochrome [Planctomycetales bacterium]
ARATTAGASSEVPTIAAGTAAAIERGRQAYMASGCAQCHGSDGKGDSAMVMLDAEQMPSTARDFTRGIFKGGHDPQSLYRRIVYGMPGTPMPSSSQLAAAEVADIVHFIRSLSSEAQRQSVVLNRETIRARRVASELPQSGDSPAWARAESVQLRVMPLWWTGAAQPELSVQALHDGTSLAVRVSWADDSQDQRAVRSEGFEDALAMQLCAGPDEPFLGMGSHQAAVDIWYWDADRQLRSSGYAEPYPQAVVDRYPLSEGAVTAVDIERPGGQLASQAELSLPARASGNPLLSHGRQSGGSSLSAEGPGSITFRPPLSRLVVADGRWSDGRWSVVLRRSLATASAADGVSLVPGGRVSAAFAVWNGARQERANHKSITLWQDLELE